MSLFYHGLFSQPAFDCHVRWILIVSEKDLYRQPVITRNLETIRDLSYPRHLIACQPPPVEIKIGLDAFWHNGLWKHTSSPLDPPR